jgi:hypothetical protein
LLAFSYEEGKSNKKNKNSEVRKNRNPTVFSCRHDTTRHDTSSPRLEGRTLYDGYRTVLNNDIAVPNTCTLILLVNILKTFF